MSRFFRSIKPLLRTVGTVSAPCSVAFGVAAAVPNNADAPEYVQDVFQQFSSNYEHRQSDSYQRQTGMDRTHSQRAEQAVPEPTASNLLPAATDQKLQKMESAQPVSSETVSESEGAQYLAEFIDHTVLKPKSTEQDIEKMCAEAVEHHFFSVCCNPCWVRRCKELLSGSEVKICCVVGFPLGANTSDIKALEAMHAVHDGADEIDMVMNIGRARSGDWDFVQSDIAKVVDAVGADGVAVKVILETCLLSDEEVAAACECATRAKAKFVKTSTGFGGGGATVHHVQLMRRTVDEVAASLGMDVGSVFVKASGGIRDQQKAEQMIEAGANRIGASSGIKIIGAHSASTISAVPAAATTPTATAVTAQEQY